MQGHDNRPRRPLWVKMGLWGLPTRAAAWGFLWLSLTIAAGCIAYGFVNPLFFCGGLLILSALWYYLSIRWVDRHDDW